MNIFGEKRKKELDLNLYKILFNEYNKRVYKTAYFILKDDFEAKDIVQEAFIIAYEKLDNLKDKEKFGSWICTIASNLAKKRYTKRKKEILIDDTIKITPFLDKSNVLFNIPEELLEEKEFKDFIKNCVNELKIHYKQVLILYYYHDLSYKEISIYLDINIGTVKSRINRAKNALNNEISKNKYFKNII